MFSDLTLDLTLILIFLLQGHITIGFFNPDNLRICEFSRFPRPVQCMYVPITYISQHSKFTWTLTFQVQGHITVGLRSSDNLGVSEVSNLPRPVEMQVGHHDLILYPTNFQGQGQGQGHYIPWGCPKIRCI
jgi:hypothetical protein